MKMIDNEVWNLLKIVILIGELRATSDNIVYTLQAYALVLRGIAFGNIVYAGNVKQNAHFGRRILT
jgi:hypothetical protein